MMTALLSLLCFLSIFLLPGFLLFRLIEQRYHTKTQHCFSTHLAASYVLSFFLLFIPGLILAKSNNFTENSILLVLITEFLLLSFLLWRNKLHRISLGQRKFCGWASLSLLAVLAFHLRELILNPVLRGGFFYLSEAKYIIDAKGIPDTVLHFGLPIVPQVDKFGFDLQLAAYLLLGSPDIVRLQQIGYLASVLIGSLIVFGLFSQITSRPFAAASTILLYANTVFGNVVTSRSFFIPESSAFICFAATLLLYFKLDNYRRKNSDSAKLWLLILISLAMSACALQHLEVALLLPLFLIAYSIISSFSHKSMLPITQVLLLGGISALLFFSSYLLLNISPEFAATEHAPEAFLAYQGFDPTWEYLRLGHPQTHPIPFPTPPYFSSLSSLLQEILSSQGSFYQSLNARLIFAFILITTFLHLLIQTIRSEPSQTTALPILHLAWAALAVTFSIIFLAYWSNADATVFVYQTEIVRRVAPYLSFFFLLLLIPLFETLQVTAPRLSHFMLWLLIGGCYYLSFPWQKSIANLFQVSPSGMEALQQLRETPSSTNEFVLSNYVTSGTFHVLAKKNARLEGHQPVLRPKLLLDTLERIEQARAFFAAPKANLFLLKNWQVRFVVFKTDSSLDLAGIPILSPSINFSQILDELHQVLCYRRSFQQIHLFEVCSLGSVGKSGK